MNKMKKRLVLNISIFLLAMGGLFGLLSGCSNSVEVEPPITDNGIRVYLELPFSEKNDSVNSDFASARSAVPSSSAFGNGTNHLVFAAALHASGETATLKEASYTPENGSTPSSVLIPFEISSTARTGYVLDIYAFATGYDHSSGFTASDALLFGQVTGINISSNVSSLSISDPIKMKRNVANTTTRGSVELAISIPAGYSLACNNSNFSCTASSIAASSIAHGEYNVTFFIAKDGEPVYVWSEMIYVYPGLKTDTWNTGEVNASGAREISSVTMESTFFVRGDGGSWFAANMSGAAAGNDTTGNGSLAKPYATMQKVIERIKAINDTTTEYTIYVDGTVTATGESGLVMELKNLSSPVNIKIVGLGSEMAVLSAGRARTDVIEIKDNGSNKIALTLENLKLTGVGTSANPAPESGAIFAEKYTDITLKNCEVSENYCQWGGALRFGHHCNITIDGGEYKDNHATSNGGVINANGTNWDISGAGDELSITIKGGAKFSNNTSAADGGAFYFTNCKEGPTCIIEAAEFTNNTANSGDSIYIDSGNITLSGSVKIDEDNDVYLASGTFITITGDLTGTAPVATITPASYDSNPIVLKAATAALIADNIDKFALPSTATNYAIAQDDINTTNAVIVDNTPRATVYLDATSGSDINDGSTKAKAVKTLTRATSILDYTAATPKIIVVSPYKLASTETTLLDFSEKANAPTLERYYSSSSDYCNGNLLMIFSGTVAIKNVTFDGNWKTSGGTGSEQLANAGGALLYVNGAIVTLCADCTIKNNSLSGNGGGVCNYGTFTMSGGTISGNSASSYGGGIYNYGTFTMSDGIISGNKATSSGGGIYNSGTLNFSGAAAVDSNNDVYLESGKFITITGDLTGTAPVATITPKTYAVNTVVLKAATAALITANYNKFALSDTSTYEICPDSATPTQAILIMPQAGGGVGLLGSDFVFTPKINGAAVSAGTTLGDGDTLTFSVAPDSISGVTFTKYKISVLNGSAEIPALTASGSSLTDASVTITAQQAQKFAQVGAVVDIHMEITVKVNSNDYVFDRTIKGFTFN